MAPEEPVRKLLSIAAVAALAVAAGQALAGPSPADILAANRAAMGGDAWAGKSALRIDYAYVGHGLTGKTESLEDLKTGHFFDSYDIGSISGASGFDGTNAWAKDPSGTVTLQAGGDQRQLAINEAYRDANLWWRPDHAGATIVNDGRRRHDGKDYDVLAVTPSGGKPFEAWFDARSHLLSRIIETQGSDTVITTLSDYKTVDGVLLAGTATQSNGDRKYDRIQTLNHAAFLPAQDDAAFAPPDPRIDDFSIAGGADETTLPFELLNNHIYADVRINGKGPYFFIFDTGGVNLVTPPMAKALGLKAEGRVQAVGAGAGHMEAKLTKVASLRLGAATVTNQVFTVLPLNTLDDIEGLGETGLIGFETFRRFVTRIDYSKHTITLIKPSAFDPTNAGTAVPIVFDGNTIEAKASYDGIEGGFTIDTGSRASLILNSPFATDHKLPDTATIGVNAVIGWGVGGPSHAFIIRGGTLVLGGHTIKDPVVAMSTDKSGAFAVASLAGNIGTGILKRFVVTFDYGHSLMYLKPVPHELADLDTYDRAGMWFNVDERGFDVIAITKGGPADKAGLQRGDIITRIDGMPANQIKLYDLRRRLRDDTPGTVLALTVLRGDESRVVMLTLKNQI